MDPIADTSEPSDETTRDETVDRPGFYQTLKSSSPGFNLASPKEKAMYVQFGERGYAFHATPVNPHGAPAVFRQIGHKKMLIAALKKYNDFRMRKKTLAILYPSLSEFNWIQKLRNESDKNKRPNIKFYREKYYPGDKARSYPIFPLDGLKDRLCPVYVMRDCMYFYTPENLIRMLPNLSETLDQVPGGRVFVFTMNHRLEGMDWCKRKYPKVRDVRNDDGEVEYLQTEEDLDVFLGAWRRDGDEVTYYTSDGQDTNETCRRHAYLCDWLYETKSQWVSVDGSYYWLDIAEISTLNTISTCCVSIERIDSIRPELLVFSEQPTLSRYVLGRHLPHLEGFTLSVDDDLYYNWWKILGMLSHATSVDKTVPSQLRSLNRRLTREPSGGVPGVLRLEASLADHRTRNLLLSLGVAPVALNHELSEPVSVRVRRRAMAGRMPAFGDYAEDVAKLTEKKTILELASDSFLLLVRVLKDLGIKIKGIFSDLRRKWKKSPLEDCEVDFLPLNVLQNLFCVLRDRFPAWERIKDTKIVGKFSLWMVLQRLSSKYSPPAWLRPLLELLMSSFALIGSVALETWIAQTRSALTFLMVALDVITTFLRRLHSGESYLEAMLYQLPTILAHLLFALCPFPLAFLIHLLYDFAANYEHFRNLFLQIIDYLKQDPEELRKEAGGLVPETQQELMKELNVFVQDNGLTDAVIRFGENMPWTDLDKFDWSVIPCPKSRLYPLVGIRKSLDYFPECEIGTPIFWKPSHSLDNVLLTLFKRQARAPSLPCSRKVLGTMIGNIVEHWKTPYRVVSVWNAISGGMEPPFLTEFYQLPVTSFSSLTNEEMLEHARRRKTEKTLGQYYIAVEQDENLDYSEKNPDSLRVKSDEKLFKAKPRNITVIHIANMWEEGKWIASATNQFMELVNGFDPVGEGTELEELKIYHYRGLNYTIMFYDGWSADHLSIRANAIKNIEGVHFLFANDDSEISVSYNGKLKGLGLDIRNCDNSTRETHHRLVHSWMIFFGSDLTWEEYSKNCNGERKIRINMGDKEAIYIKWLQRQMITATGRFATHVCVDWVQLSNAHRCIRKFVEGRYQQSCVGVGQAPDFSAEDFRPSDFLSCCAEIGYEMTCRIPEALKMDEFVDYILVDFVSGTYDINVDGQYSWHPISCSKIFWGSVDPGTLFPERSKIEADSLYLKCLLLGCKGYYDREPIGKGFLELVECELEERGVDDNTFSTEAVSEGILRIFQRDWKFDMMRRCQMKEEMINPELDMDLYYKKLIWWGYLQEIPLPSSFASRAEEVNLVEESIGMLSTARLPVEAWGDQFLEWMAILHYH